MKKIYKYELKHTSDVFSIRMPIGAEILSLQVQNNSPHIWALVDPNAELINRHFAIFATGESVSNYDISKFIGTYQLHQVYVFHCFELIRK